MLLRVTPLWRPATSAVPIRRIPTARRSRRCRCPSWLQKVLVLKMSQIQAILFERPKHQSIRLSIRRQVSLHLTVTSHDRLWPSLLHSLVITEKTQAPLRSSPPFLSPRPRMHLSKVLVQLNVVQSLSDLSARRQCRPVGIPVHTHSPDYSTSSHGAVHAQRRVSIGNRVDSARSVDHIEISIEASRRCRLHVRVMPLEASAADPGRSMW